MEMLLQFLSNTGYYLADYRHILMLMVGCLFVYLGTAKKYEPLLLIPIGFGVIVGNIPFFKGFGLGVYEPGSVLNYLYFGVRTGMEWAKHVDSNGAEGVEPPDYVKQIISDINDFQSADQSSQAFRDLGNRLVKNMTENLLFIGTVNAPAPTIHHNNLKNFSSFKTHSYEYYRTYPYRATQWWLDE